MSSLKKIKGTPVEPIDLDKIRQRYDSASEPVAIVQKEREADERFWEGNQYE